MTPGSDEKRENSENLDGARVGTLKAKTPAMAQSRPCNAKTKEVMVIKVSQKKRKRAPPGLDERERPKDGGVGKSKGIGIGGNGELKYFRSSD